MIGHGTARTRVTYTLRIQPGEPVSPLSAAAPVDFHRPPGGLPEFCRLILSSAGPSGQPVETEAWLPVVTWNGRFRAIGGSGSPQTTRYREMAAAIVRGDAAASVDPAGRLPAGEARADALHDAMLAVKRVMAVYYGQLPTESYWTGCAAGGRDGLEILQRYPDDYDGALVGAPADGSPASSVRPPSNAALDLSSFAARGGKLLIYDRLDDQAPRGRTVETFSSASRLLKAPGDSVRLYLLPDPSACPPADGPVVRSIERALEDWVEVATPPGPFVIATPPATSVRAICPFPSAAVYSGTGPREDARNYVCR